jgi:hypothetical protein
LHLRGDAAGAVTALTRQDDLKAEDDPTNFFLPMALHAVGERDRAREHYLRAVTWMADHPSEDTPWRLRRRSEAASVLGPE